MTAGSSDRAPEVIADARAVVVAIEDRSLPLSRVALKSRRLAPAVDDEQAYWWLRFECEGLTSTTPPPSPIEDLGAVPQAVEKFRATRATVNFNNFTWDELTTLIARGESLERHHVMSTSLAVLEAEPGLREREEEIQRATAGILTASEQQTVHQAIGILRLREAERQAVLERVASAIHEWASAIYVTWRFREMAASIFERFKTSSDALLIRLCPGAIAKLTDALHRADSQKPEDWAAAALSCRRVLKEFADAVYSPRAGTIDGREVDDVHYKNRLWAFAKQSGKRAEDLFLSVEEIEGLCRGLDRVYDLAGKGIHADLGRDEADLAVLRTYILLTQLAQLADSK